MPLNTTGNRIVLAAVLLISLLWSLAKNILRFESNNNNVESEDMMASTSFVSFQD